MSPLEIIGNIDIPTSVMMHRFVREALGCAHIMAKNVEGGDSREQVVGTANNKAVELYGWAPHVDSHADNTGFVYLVALNEGRSTVNVWADFEPISVWLPAGTVVRLDDRKMHWTEDDRVRAFVGSFAEPRDDQALTQLQAGVTNLAKGDYYGTPRVSSGFRVLMPDECLIPNAVYDNCDPMLVADARKQRLRYERCTHCKKPAVRLDHHWPYSQANNRCIDHMRAEV
jgi:hypothetical protein